MAKLSNEALVYTSAYGARDPIKTAAGVTESFHKGSDFGPVPRGKEGVVLCAVYAGRATWLGDQYGALGVRVTATATAAQAELLQRLYGRGRAGSTMQFDVWHVEKRLAARGSDVGAGAAIAIMGTTGRSTGIHTHAEFRIDGVVVDPKPFIDAQATRSVEDAPDDYYGEGFLMALTADEQRDAKVKIDRIEAALLQGGFYMTNAILDDQRRAETGILEALAALAVRASHNGTNIGKIHDTTGRTERRQIEQGWLFGKMWDHMTGKPEGSTVALTEEDRAALIEGIAAMLDRDSDAVREVGEALLRVANEEPTT